MDYDNASDDEISRAVQHVKQGEMLWCPLIDYCNSWSDSGPIITENGIGIYHNRHGIWESECAIVDGSTTSVYEYEDKNPLRACMIVFLQLKENSHD